MVNEPEFAPDQQALWQVMLEVVERVARPYYAEDTNYCQLCGYQRTWVTQRPDHYESCPVQQLKALLAQSP